MVAAATLCTSSGMSSLGAWSGSVRVASQTPSSSDAAATRLSSVGPFLTFFSVDRDRSGRCKRWRDGKERGKTLLYDPVFEG